MNTLTDTPTQLFTYRVALLNGLWAECRSTLGWPAFYVDAKAAGQVFMDTGAVPWHAVAWIMRGDMPLQSGGNVVAMTPNGKPN